MADKEKFEGPPVVAGRTNELDRFAACERGLADAFAEFARRTHGGARWLELAERHRGFASLLAARMVELGGTPDSDSDSAWIVGPPDRLATLLFAEHQALRTYHDHLIDLDPSTMRLIRDHVLPAHERTFAELTGAADPAMESNQR